MRSQITLTNENGQEEVFNILLDFKSPEFNKSFMVVYLEAQEAVDGQISVIPLSYTEDAEGNITSIDDIESREEFELVKAEFEKMVHEQMHGHDCCGHCHDEDHECDHHHHDGEHECHCHHDHDEE